MPRGTRRGGHPARADAPPPQPDLPEGEVRLVSVRQETAGVILELEGGRRLELAPAAVPAGLPEAGGMLDEALHQAVVLAAERKRAARRLFALLDRRLQPVARLRRKLVDEGYLIPAVDAVLARMQDEGLHSDRRFAEAWCRDCLLSRAVGRAYLENKLRAKSIDGALAREVAATSLDPEQERELAQRAATARWRQLGDARDRRALAKVVRHLQGRGFATGLAVAVARQCAPTDEGE